MNFNVGGVVMSGFPGDEKSGFVLNASRRFGIESGNKKILNHRFGRLLVIKFDSFSEKKKGPTRWLCKCDCGKEIVVARNNLVTGDTQSCGCLQIDRTRTHGMSTSDEYRIWRHIRTRCGNKNNPVYHHYGGRGIIVCERWLESFENFYRDMGKRPTVNHTIERINNNGNYEPGNCKWATMKEQCNNTRRNVIMEAFGEKKTFAQWCELYNQKYCTVKNRMVRSGLSLEQALTKDATINRPNTNALKLCGHADWKRCRYCHTFASPETLFFPKIGTPFHRECANLYKRNATIRKQQERSNHERPS